MPSDQSGCTLLSVFAPVYIEEAILIDQPSVAICQAVMVQTKAEEQKVRTTL